MNHVRRSPVQVRQEPDLLATGQGAEMGEGPGRLVCIDPRKQGDVSSELAVDARGKVVPPRRTYAVDLKNGEKAVRNPMDGRDAIC